MKDNSIIPYIEILKKIHKKNNKNLKIKVYSLYNFNSQILQNYIDYFLQQHKINVSFLGSEYDQIEQEILSPNFSQKVKKSRFLIIGSDINKKIFFNIDLVDDYLQNLKNNLTQSLLKTKSLKNFDIIFFNCTMLLTSCFSSNRNFEKIQEKIQKFNNYLTDQSKKNKNLVLVDIDRLTRLVGINNFYDDANFYLSKTPYAEISNISISREISKKIVAECRARKKCLVLDLDNTIWGGVLGEEGINGIDLGKTFYGECFRNFQRYLKILQQKGIILAICSKNNLKDVKECFSKNDEMILKLDDFSSFQINWEEKFVNINKIAKELNLGKDSIVFFDDSNFEREQMKKFNPEIITLDVPKNPENFIEVIENSFSFYQNKETEDDKKKKYQYDLMRKANNAKINSKNIEDFLKNLSMKLEISSIKNSNFDRSVQLTNKTNQFNLTTKRFSNSQMKNYLKSKNQLSLVARLKDKFGDHGITALIMSKKKSEDLWTIDNFLLSCRIFGRGIENIFLHELLKKLKLKKVKNIEGKFIKSEKNSMCKNFYLNNKFKKKNGDFIFDLKNLGKIKKNYINVKYIK